MNRRAFLKSIGLAFITVTAASSLKGCGGDNNTAAPADGFSVTSSPDNMAHSHAVFILSSDLSNPPSGGASYTSDGAHVHTITLTQQQLIDINNGLTVTVVSSLEFAHTHTWAIAKP